MWCSRPAAVATLCLLVVAGGTATAAAAGSGELTRTDGGATVGWNHTDTGVEGSFYVGAVPVAGTDEVYAVGAFQRAETDPVRVQVVRFSPAGSVAERRLFAFGNGTDSQPSAVVRSGDGGFYVVGSTTTDDGSEDAFVARFDRNGTLRWNRTLGGERPDAALAAAVTEAGVAVGGVYGGESGDGGRPWLFELASDGDRLRNVTLGAAGWSTGTVVVREDGVVLVGQTAPLDGTDGWIARVEGERVRTNVTYAVETADRFGAQEAVYSDGEVVVVGGLSNASGGSGALLTVDPESGEVENVTRLSNFSLPRAIVPNGRGGYYVAGSTGFDLLGNGSGSVGVVVGIGADGEREWRLEAPDSRNLTELFGIDRAGSRLVATGLTDFRLPDGTARSRRFNGSVLAVGPPEPDLVDCLGGAGDVEATEVLRTIAAYNSGERVCGTVPDAPDVLAVISAFNAADD